MPAVLAPLAVGAALGIGAGRIAVQARPATTVRLLPVLSALCALTLLSSATAVALTLIHHRPGTTSVAVAAILLTAALCATAGGLRHLWHVRQNLCAATRFCRILPRTEGYLLARSPVADAYSVPGRGGGIVVTTAMKSALTEDELTVLLAHEHAHLRHHHSRWIQIAETAAALHPLLRPVPDVVRRAAERWADEEAAAGGRRAAAQAVAAAAVARSRSLEVHSSTTLSMAGGDVVERVHALVDPPRLPWARTVAATLIVAIALVSFSALRTTDIVQDVLLPEHETPHLVLQR